MENQSTLVEADAVHHRLSNQVNSVIHLPYRCYDCSQSFFGLEQLTQHFLEEPLHSKEICLKCETPIIVFFKSMQPVRLHSCIKSSMCHNLPDLNFHSQFLFSKLQSSCEIPVCTVIGCDIQSCKASFNFSVSGIFKYLKHASKYSHTTVPCCKKCLLPEFQVTVGGKRIISHYCTKTGKIICVDKTWFSLSNRLKLRVKKAYLTLVTTKFLFLPYFYPIPQHLSHSARFIVMFGNDVQLLRKLLLVYQHNRGIRKGKIRYRLYWPLFIYGVLNNTCVLLTCGLTKPGCVQLSKISSSRQQDSGGYSIDGRLSTRNWR